ncbi:MAG: DUF4198 domain-containing protein [Acidobacteriota bacterium]|jgi:uncharacterized GH25 family protein
MKPRTSIPLFLILLTAFVAAAAAHDLYLVVEDHDVPAHAEMTVALYNGTFSTSENTIDRERMTDVTIVDGRGREVHPAADRWREEGNATLLDVETGAPGTYLLGVSTRARMIELSAEEFEDYLEHDGVLDVLEARRAAREGGESAERSARTGGGPVRERYAKHVKTLLDVGGEATDTFSHRLGYPVEIVPLENPALLEVGRELPVLVLADGEPLADQLVYAGYAAHDAHQGEHDHRNAVETRTDAEGVARIGLDHPGRWYIRLIHMVPSGEEGVDYVSEWATLTFDVD